MHPTIQHQITRARIADLHRQAERGRVAQAASRARRTRRGNRGQRGPVHTFLARRLLTLLAARSRPAPAQPRSLASQPPAPGNTSL